MDILNIILNAIAKFFSTLQVKAPRGDELYPPDEDADKLEDLESFYNPAAFLSAQENFLKNKAAYNAGIQTWKSGKIGNEFFNDILFYKTTDANPRYFKAFRLYNENGFKLIKHEETTKNDFDQNTRGKETSTFCNVVAGLFSRIYCPEIGSIQFYNGKEYSANQLIKNLKKGFYNSENFGFKQCDTQDEAVAYAGRGGLALALWVNPFPGKADHVAILNGRYNWTGDKKDPVILQAGKYTGEMSLSKGFGGTALKKIFYFKLIKAV